MVCKLTEKLYQSLERWEGETLRQSKSPATKAVPKRSVVKNIPEGKCGYKRAYIKLETAKSSGVNMGTEELVDRHQGVVNLLANKFLKSSSWKRLDFYHSSEHPWELAFHPHPDNPQAARQWIKTLTPFAAP